MSSRPMAGTGIVNKAMAEAEREDLLLDLLERQFMVIPHADELLDLFLLGGRNMYLLIRMMSEAKCSTAKRSKIPDKSGIRFSPIIRNPLRQQWNGFESAMTVMTLPEGMRRFFRTSNHIERLNRELKRRSGVIGIFPNEDSLIRLMELS